MTRLGETFFFGIIVLGGVVAAAGPVIASGITGGFNLKANDPLEYIRTYVFAHPILLGYLLILLTIVSFVAVALHSYIQGGSFATYLEGERAAATREPATAGRFRVFDIDRWFVSARRFWWKFFVVYNVVWGIYFSVMLVPLLVIAVAAFSFGETKAAAIVGCSGLAFWVLLLVVSSIFVSIWSQLVLAALVRDDSALRVALRTGWGILLHQAGTIVVAVLILFAISFGVGLMLAAFFSGAGVVEDYPGASMILLPFMIVFSFAQMVFSYFTAAWFTATFVAIVARDPQPRVGLSTRA